MCRGGKSGAGMFKAIDMMLGKLYTGQTQDLNQRVEAHNSGFSRYTKGRGPWKLVHHEEYDSRGAAMKREMFLKSGKGRELVKKLIKG